MLRSANTRLALAKNPYESTALANLAVIEAAEVELGQAMKLLEMVVAADPSQTAAGLDLAFLQCRLGEKPQALDTAEEMKRFNPDSPAVHEFLDYGRYGGQTCRVK
jgi:tetratricopeptide (TPR) repeat protein